MNKIDYMLFLYIATILGQFKHYHMTKRINALRKHCRLTMKAKNPKDYDERMQIAIEADKIWKEIQDDDRFDSDTKITTVASLRAIYDMMSPDQKLIPEKKFEAALHSIENIAQDSDQEVENTKNAYAIAEVIREKLGLKSSKPNLGLLKNKIRNNLIIEGKIK